MRLFLSSQGTGSKEASSKLASILPRGSKIAIILNALDGQHAFAKEAVLKREADLLKELGYSPDVVDLKNYFASYTQLRKKLSKYNATWVVGGNVFLLIKIMKEANFKLAIEPLLNSNELLYGGYSAGACAAGSNIRGLEIVTPPEATRRKIGTREVTWEPLSLVSYIRHFDVSSG